ncbi:unnamed protein product [Musa acuminata subsp. malaccensis]|uniref:(wild Malaysian banana) hypothetical protein n=1 Tax=Musa acuminata subsp. malaccensis TaxID=214687 RepID=A0A8D6ZSR6_MUSAM|nr:unnamed protein product [Musa acuminata subsp. malaccensis]
MEVVNQYRLNQNPIQIQFSTYGKNFQEHLEHFISKQKSCFQVVLNRLLINQYLIDWSKAINKQHLSKSLHFFLSKSLPFLFKTLPLFFMSIGC